MKLARDVESKIEGSERVEGQYVGRFETGVSSEKIAASHPKGRDMGTRRDVEHWNLLGYSKLGTNWANQAQRASTGVSE